MNIGDTIVVTPEFMGLIRRGDIRPIGTAVIGKELRIEKIKERTCNLIGANFYCDSVPKAYVQAMRIAYERLIAP